MNTRQIRLAKRQNPTMQRDGVRTTVRRTNCRLLALAAAAVAVLLLVGVAGKHDQTLELYQNIIESCEQAQPDCMALIQRAEATGNVEVLSQGNHYWVEVK